MSTNRSSRKRENVSNLVRLYKYEDGSETAKLSFARLARHSPDLGNRLELLLGKIKQWETNFGNDAILANRRFNATTACAIGVGLGSIVVAILSSLKLAQTSWALTALLVAFGTLAAVVGAIGQAYGWHKRYKAMFGARWEMTALRLAVEQEAINFALSQKEGTDLSPEQTKLLSSRTEEWTKEVARILGTFGHDYGSSLQPVQLPSNSGTLR